MANCFATCQFSAALCNYKTDHFLLEVNNYSVLRNHFAVITLKIGNRIILLAFVLGQNGPGFICSLASKKKD